MADWWAAGHAGSKHRHPTEKLHLLCQEGARGKETLTQIIQTCGKNPLQVDWESCRAGRGIDGKGREAEMSSRSGTETGTGTDSIIQLFEVCCPSLEQEASQVCSRLWNLFETNDPSVLPDLLLSPGDRLLSAVRRYLFSHLIVYLYNQGTKKHWWHENNFYPWLQTTNATLD